MKIEAKKPIVTGQKVTEPEMTLTSAPTPMFMDPEKPAILSGGLMQLNFVPAFWTK
jgi:hypothetical protein